MLESNPGLLRLRHWQSDGARHIITFSLYLNTRRKKTPQCVVHNKILHQCCTIYALLRLYLISKPKKLIFTVSCSGLGSLLGKGGPLSPSLLCGGSRHHPYITCNCGQAFPSLSLLEGHMARTHPDNTNIVSTLQRKSHLCIPFLGIVRPQS